MILNIKNGIILSSITLLLISCIPDNVENEMKKGMQQSMAMFADQNFKRAVALIELHKLRNGTYPERLNELQYLSVMDSTIFNTVSYNKLEKGYELNIVNQYDNNLRVGEANANIHLPEDFWKGLGCVKSNLKKYL